MLILYRTILYIYLYCTTILYRPVSPSFVFHSPKLLTRVLTVTVTVTVVVTKASSS